MGKGGRPLKVDAALNELSYVIESGDQRRLEEIIAIYGIDAYDGDKRTAIIWASFWGNIEMLSWLISQDADLDHQDKIGYSSLHFCGQEYRIEIAKILLAKGANPRVLDEHGNAPLWTALFSSKGNFAIVELLMIHGAHPNQKNKYGKSPNELALSIYGKKIDALIGNATTEDKV